MATSKKTKQETRTEGQQRAARDGKLAGIPDSCRRAVEAMEDAEKRATEAGEPDLATEARAILSTIRELWKDADKVIRPGAYAKREEVELL